MISRNAAKSRTLSIFPVLIVSLGFAISGRLAFGVEPGCGPEFSKVAAQARPGAIPEFKPFFSPVLSRTELERAAENVPAGTSIKKFVEHGYNTWSVEKLNVEGRPQIVTVKRSRMEGEPQ